jgi:hypothetical protein
VSYKWKAVSGSWDFGKDSLVQTNPKDISRCFVGTNLSSYIVSFKMKMTTHQNGHPGEGKFIFSGAHKNEDCRIDFIYDPLGVCRVSIGQLQFGALVQLTHGQIYPIKIILKDNLLSVHVNQMLIIPEMNLGRRSDGNIGFGTWMSAVEFSDVEILPFRQVKCFVIMPFDQKRNFLYDTVIKPTLELHPSIVFDFKRADESLTTGKISEEIVEFIRDAQIIIADITSANPNVYYELGYAHASSRKAILLIEKVEGQKLSLPFDIQDFRCHPYRFSKDGFEDIKHKLTGIVQRLI